MHADSSKANKTSSDMIHLNKSCLHNLLYNLFPCVNYFLKYLASPYWEEESDGEKGREGEYSIL